jgi:hypothetical protein
LPMSASRLCLAQEKTAAVRSLYSQSIFSAAIT